MSLRSSMGDTCSRGMSSQRYQVTSSAFIWYGSGGLQLSPYDYGARRERELDLLGREATQEINVDGVLNVGIPVVFRIQHVIDDLEAQRRLGPLEKVATAESHRGLLFDH